MAVADFVTLPENKGSQAVCIGCGCTDHRACIGNAGPCYWLRVDYEAGFGVCSECPGDLSRFDAGDRTVHSRPED
jgi:hypothetical protein